MSVAFSKACLLASAEAWHAPNDTRHAKRKLIIKNMGHGPREFGLWIPRRSTWQSSCQACGLWPRASGKIAPSIWRLSLATS